MKHFKDIVSSYEIAKSNLLDRWAYVFDASKEPDKELDEINRLILVNENAYSILLVSQLESEVNRLCEDAIRSGRRLRDWNHRRAWDVLGQKDVRNIHFMDRVALLTDKGRKVYSDIKALYDTRNKIAHGDLLTEIPDVAETAKDIERIAVQLKGVP